MWTPVMQEDADVLTGIVTNSTRPPGLCLYGLFCSSSSLPIPSPSILHRFPLPLQALRILPLPYNSFFPFPVFPSAPSHQHPFSPRRFPLTAYLTLLRSMTRYMCGTLSLTPCFFPEDEMSDSGSIG